MKRTLSLLLVLSLSAVTALPLRASTDEAAQVLEMIGRVNDYWQTHNTPYVRSFWDHAAYHTGNMEAYRLTGRADWYAYTDRWCRHNEWKGARSDDRASWKYKTYGEGQDFVLFGDWQICFQTYIDMYNLVPAPYKVARAIDVMSHECDMEDTHFWWWADALYMVMPVMTKMYKLTGEVRYLDKLHANFLWSDSLMYDPEEQLYYRDAKYIYPKVQTACNGGKSFWARGDGWVLAGLSKVLADMPQDYAHRDIFVQRFRQLAEGVARVQRPDGYWSRSMLCEDDAPGPETSGTAFFTYGMLWGVRHGYLDRNRFMPVIQKAWKYLSETALQADGSIGFVQPIGEKPDPTKTVDAHSQAPFGTGAWLLAACEMVRYLDDAPDMPAPDPDRVTTSVYHYTPGTTTVGFPVSGGSYTALPSAPTAATVADRARGREHCGTFEIANPTADNICQVVELTTMEALRKAGIAVAREFIVQDSEGYEVPYQITRDGRVLVMASVRAGSSVTLTMVKGQPLDYELTANGRVYPNRWDDLVWENDRSAWRLYGPEAHRRMKNPAYGFDTFVKNTPHPVQDQLYHNELTSYGVHDRMTRDRSALDWNRVHRGYTYHRNHGAGMDAYTVGATLGAGAPALMKGTELYMPIQYATAEIIDNGPLRFTVMQTLPARDVDGVQVVERRLITQDCGSHFARVEVTYEGLDHEMDVCAGIVVHDSAPRAYTLDRKNASATYAEALDHPEAMLGEHYLGVFLPAGTKPVTAKYIPLSEPRSGGIGHAVVATRYRPGTPFTYYTGSAWSLYDVPTHAVWQQTLRHEAAIVQQGLQLTVR